MRCIGIPTKLRLAGEGRSNPAVLSTARARSVVNIHGAVNLETFRAPFVEAHNR